MIKENYDGQYMDKPLPRDYKVVRTESRKLDFSGLRQKIDQISQIKLTKKQVKTIGIVLGAVLVLLIGRGIVKSCTGPEQTAKRFFRREMIQGDSGAVYSMLDLPEGKFMGREQFLEIYPELPAVDISNYEVKVTNNEYSSEPSFVSQCQVQYSIKGEEQIGYNRYQLIKMGKVIPKWKVSTSTYVARDVRIYAPEAVRIWLDGIELEETDKVYGGNGFWYEVDVFTGFHELYAEAEYMEPQTFVVEFYEGEFYELPQLNLSQSAIDTMSDTMKDFHKDLYSIAYDDGDPSALEDYMSSYGTEEMYDCYYDVRNSMHKDNMILGDLEFSNYNARLRDVSQYGGAIYVEMVLDYEYEYDYQYLYQSWYDEEMRTKERNSESSMFVTFVLEENTWKVDEVSLYTIY